MGVLSWLRALLSKTEQPYVPPTLDAAVETLLTRMPGEIRLDILRNDGLDFRHREALVDHLRQRWRLDEPQALTDWFDLHADIRDPYDMAQLIVDAFEARVLGQPWHLGYEAGEYRQARQWEARRDT